MGWMGKGVWVGLECPDTLEDVQEGDIREGEDGGGDGGCDYAMVIVTVENNKTNRCLSDGLLHIRYAMQLLKSKPKGQEEG